ncbi:hypothetical protein [Kitasatospora purpeofusca]|uniref:hypothetical protein n=1 Tax=Kitasatospora purpeofusca TaxID=67352 RepID=UPI00386DE96C
MGTHNIAAACLRHGARLLHTSTSEVERLLSENRKAREPAGWQPQVGLDEGLRRTSDWVAEHLHLLPRAVTRSDAGTRGGEGLGPARALPRESDGVP